ncbi:GDSL-type esterase/lipase family protein [Streptomyces sp. NPDC007088]|uniref:GDSL-type esterase/lipase family protein n=1 Tax=Streptomyces sp. NPDC007088 TaxID=3364773 RepID=UPI0036B59075
MRFLFVGDSQTIGRAGDHTWRYRMWQHLGASFGGPFKIVGPRDGLYDPSADAPVSYAYADEDWPLHARRHLAGWGEGWQHMVPLVGDAVRGGKAQVLLVALGLIDLGFYTNSEQTADNVRRFFAEARAANPGVRAVVLPVIPNIRAQADDSFAEEVDHFNTLLAKAVAELDSPSSPLLLASLPQDYDIHRDTYDGTHPGPSGERRIAAAFATALHQGWGLGGPYEDR